MSDQKTLEIEDPLKDGKLWASGATPAMSKGKLIGVVVWGEKEASACFVYPENIHRLIEKLQKILKEHPP